MVMKLKTYLRVSGTLFCLVGILHGSRVVTGADLVYAGYAVPAWLSGVGALFLWYLSYHAFKLAGKKK